MIYITIIFFIILNVVEMTRVGSEKLSWKTENTPTDKTEQVTSDMKQGLRTLSF